jgi:HD-GYP domain-containing protein (c-di-GMP phosphodiesterase class II)
MNYTLNLKEVTYALSEALDLVGVDDVLHGKRVAYMAAEIAKEMKYSKDDIEDIIFAGMIHDCGVSSTDVHTHLINELDWDNAQVHCIRGEILLQNTSLYSKYSSIIRYHHTHWENFDDIIDQKTKTISNIIYLADRIDALRAQMKGMEIKSTQLIQKTILNHSETMFNKELVDAFINISSKGSFWYYLEEEALLEYFLEWVHTGQDKPMSFKELKEISLMFAAVVDAKSTFTSEHSIGVASLARYIAELFKLPQNMCEKVELAALLHDLGKLRVDDLILNKPAVLNADERLKMNRHGFDSDIILRRIKGFKEIAHLASLHHETLDGKGYPYELKGEMIPFEARIISTSDIYQALIQDRPYRKGMNKEDAFQIILDMTNDNKLDPQVTKKLQEHLEEATKHALTQYNIIQN